MAEVIEELISRKNSLNQEIERLQKKLGELKGKRESLLQEISEIKKELDQLTQKKEELQNNRKGRIEELRKLKGEYEPLTEEMRKLRGKAREIRRKYESEEGSSLREIERRIARIENKLQTLPLSPKREREVFEELKALYEKKARLEAALLTHKEYIEIQNKIKEIEEKLAKYREEKRKIKEELDSISRELREIRGRFKILLHRKREIKEELTRIREEENKTRVKLIELRNTVKDIEKILVALRRSGKRKAKAKPKEISEEAKKIYERFLRGEKLTLEEILILQNSGLI